MWAPSGSMWIGAAYSRTSRRSTCIVERYTSHRYACRFFLGRCVCSRLHSTSSFAILCQTRFAVWTLVVPRHVPRVPSR
jgi:hypothetical protein